MTTKAVGALAVLCCVTCILINFEVAAESDSSADYTNRLLALEKTVESLTMLADTRRAAKLEKMDSNETTVARFGVTYVRWGRNVCSGTTAAFRFYRGYMAGSRSSEYHGGVTTLCLPNNPQWGMFFDESETTNYVTGAEYYFSDMPFSTDNNDGISLKDNDAPCAMCFAPYKFKVLMIPGRIECPSIGNWTLEYTGYLVADNVGSRTRADWICLDEAPEAIVGGGGYEYGLNLNVATSYCGVLPCPPYVQGRQIPCVVCTI